jgi:hypothetical protein
MSHDYLSLEPSSSQARLFCKLGFASSIGANT